MNYLQQIYYLLPLLVVVVGGCLVLLLEAFSGAGPRRWLMQLTALICIGAGIAAWLVWRRVDYSGEVVLFDGMLVADKFSLFLTLTFLVGTFLTTLLAADYLHEHGALYGELFGLLLLAASGMIILAMAGDLVTVFLGIETMSMGAYVLTGVFRRHRRSSEAAMKYFVTGAFATGFLLYGIALVYGATGTTQLAQISAVATKNPSPLFILGQFMLVVALGFKVAVVPFHMWTPDVYEGAPTPITGFMASAVKAAGMAGLLRVFYIGFGGAVLPFGSLGWTSTLSILAAITMTWGNLAALRQENVKRMLAYSSIAHAGYLLIGVVAAGVDPKADVARPAILFYLLAYTFTTVGAFGVVSWIGRKGDERQMVDDWAGLATRHPAAAAAMTLFMLSLGGIPPTAGFFGKFYVFRAAMDGDGQFIWLVIVGVLNSVVSVYYYLRLVMAMYFREPAREPQPMVSGAMTLALAICAVAVLLMGVLPSSWLGLAVSSKTFTGP
jgi:NADH-quinone oxidoreductase subunit N